MPGLMVLQPAANSSRRAVLAELHVILRDLDTGVPPEVRHVLVTVEHFHGGLEGVGDGPEAGADGLARLAECAPSIPESTGSICSRLPFADSPAHGMIGLSGHQPSSTCICETV